MSGSTPPPAPPDEAIRAALRSLVTWATARPAPPPPPPKGP